MKLFSPTTDGAPGVSFSDRPIVWRHGERDDAHGLREGASGCSSESELQQPRQSCGVSAHSKNIVVFADLANVSQSKLLDWFITDTLVWFWAVIELSIPVKVRILYRCSYVKIFSFCVLTLAFMTWLYKLSTFSKFYFRVFQAEIRAMHQDLMQRLLQWVELLLLLHPQAVLASLPTLALHQALGEVCGP